MNPMKTIDSILSRLRGKLKAVKKDAFVTDRTLFSIVMKYAPALLKREDSKNLLITVPDIYEILHYVQLIDVDKIDSKCFRLPGHCTIKRTKYKLPELWMGYYFPLFKSVTSISGPATNATDEGELQIIHASEYASIVKQTNFKYNKTKYYWFSDGYLWFPNLEWDAVKVEGLFNEDTSSFNCETCKVCKPRQEQFFPLPEYLYPELEKFVFDDLFVPIKVPSDPVDDKQNINRP